MSRKRPARKLLPESVGKLTQRPSSVYKEFQYDPKTDSVLSKSKSPDSRHLKHESQALETILRRARRLVVQGKIRVAPVSYQTYASGARAGEVEAWAPNRPGRELRHLFPTLTERQKREVYLDLMSQLGYLHSRARVLHNDLSGGNNILISQDGKPQLTDFGHSIPLGDALEGPPFLERISMASEAASVMKYFWHTRAVTRSDRDEGFKTYMRNLRAGYGRGRLDADSERHLRETTYALLG